MYQHGEEHIEHSSPEEQAIWALPKDTVVPDEVWWYTVTRPQTISTERRMLARSDFQAYLARKLGFPSFDALAEAQGFGEISPTQYDAIDWWDALKNVLIRGDNTPKPKYEFAVDPTDNPQPLPAYEPSYENN